MTNDITRQLQESAGRRKALTDALRAESERLRRERDASARLAGQQGQNRPPGAQGRESSSGQ
jgi:hypothetical protein